MTTTSLRRRLEALEKGPSAVEEILLLMPDGSTETVHCHDVPGLLGQALHGPLTPVIELIARSVSSSEPDGAHMIDLVRALLNGPAWNGGATDAHDCAPA